MTYNPEIHHRRSIRLKGYDYSQEGAYFITICTQHREHLFGEVVDGVMCLNDAGLIVENEWKELPKHFSNIELDAFVVMPNHFHGILVIQNESTMVGAPFMGAQNSACTQDSTCVSGKPQGLPILNTTCAQDLTCVPGQPQELLIRQQQAVSHTVGTMIGAFKSLTTNEYIRGIKSKIFPSFEKRIWHRNYYEHIIRDEESCEKIREYIIRNPEKWRNDEFFY